MLDLALVYEVERVPRTHISLWDIVACGMDRCDDAQTIFFVINRCIYKTWAKAGTALPFFSFFSALPFNHLFAHLEKKNFAASENCQLDLLWLFSLLRSETKWYSALVGDVEIALCDANLIVCAIFVINILLKPSTGLNNGVYDCLTQFYFELPFNALRRTRLTCALWHSIPFLVEGKSYFLCDWHFGVHVRCGFRSDVFSFLWFFNYLRLNRMPSSTIKLITWI